MVLLQALMSLIYAEAKQVGNEGITWGCNLPVQTSTRTCKNGPMVFGLKPSRCPHSNSERCTVLRTAAVTPKGRT